MKKLLLPGAVFLLTGCPGPMDPVRVELPAQVTLVNNKVCILVPAEEGERIFSVQIGSEAEQEMLKTFGDPASQPRAVKGECLPTYGFEFKRGNSYAAYYSLEKTTTEKGRLFAARFTLSQDADGRLKILQQNQR
ncbi:putative T6SS immunity periplasmic lipoprotein [Franconibacter pulveris]|uniref:DUF7480 domain-containing protein n=1 Tax=Franconibacter pulveris TaxID=435910 RepID=A0A0J8VRZ7_9ENTR|nr:putative T6SS immunity periplasmic lipoprotein [Franconibacter pulveris]KMV35275.1 hypothetical protein ACH50_08565 [Franconibacter pulveris]